MNYQRLKQLTQVHSVHIDIICHLNKKKILKKYPIINFNKRYQFCLELSLLANE